MLISLSINPSGRNYLFWLKKVVEKVFVLGLEWDSRICQCGVDSTLKFNSLRPENASQLLTQNSN